jgi:DNA repair exonuclease SbcCD nuclease subunit
MIVGNHDSYYNSNIDVNSLKILEKFPNVQIINQITTINLNNKKIVMVPWITDIEDFNKQFSQLHDIDVCLGHFSINGFHFNKIKTSDDGIDIETFNQCRKVFSGHFHIRSSQITKNNEIVYIGAPYQLTRNDMNENRGFVIVDLNNLQYQHIDNNVSLKYIQVTYLDNVSVNSIKNNIIDVHVPYNESYNENDIDKYVQKIQEFQPAMPPNIIIENNLDVNNQIDLQNYKFGSMVDLMQEYVNSLEIENKEEIYKILINLYNESTKIDSF